jgi:hypothetical protein
MKDVSVSQVQSLLRIGGHSLFPMRRECPSRRDGRESEQGAYLSTSSEKMWGVPIWITVTAQEIGAVAQESCAVHKKTVHLPSSFGCREIIGGCRENVGSAEKTSAVPRKRRQCRENVGSVPVDAW